MDIGKNKFFSNSFWMMGGVGLQAASAFTANIVLARYLVPEDFGVFVIVLANVGIAEALANFRITPLILRIGEKDIKKKLPFYCSITMLQSIATTLIALSLLYFWEYEGSYILLLIVNSFISPMVLLQLNVYERKFNYKNVSIIESSAKLISHLCSIAGVLIGLGAIVLYARVLLETLFKATGLILYKEFKFPKFALLRIQDIRDLFIEVRDYWVDSFIEQSFERVIIIFGGFLLGERQLGFFSQAKRLAITPHQILQPLAFRVSLNYFTKAESGKRKKLLYRILRNEFILLLFVSGAMLLFSHYVVRTLYGTTWLPIVPALYAMTGMVVFLSQFNTLKSFYLATNNMKSFIVHGRVVQYLLFIGTSIVAFYLAEHDRLITLSLGLSLAYLVGFALLLIEVNKSQIDQSLKA